MDKPKFTPGPWKIATDLPALAIYAPCGERVVQTTNQNNGKGSGAAHRYEGVSTFANAHLIAAAPELYEALEATLALTETLTSEKYTVSLADLAAIQVSAEDALAKARGEHAVE